LGSIAGGGGSSKFAVELAGIRAIGGIAPPFFARWDGEGEVPRHLFSSDGSRGLAIRATCGLPSCAMWGLATRATCGLPARATSCGGNPRRVDFAGASKSLPGRKKVFATGNGLCLSSC
jgi:hypothetical protein